MITSSRLDPDMRRRRKWNKTSVDAKVYINTNKVDNLVDDWYQRNELYRATFKSKAWSIITRARNRVIVKAIKEQIPLCDSANVRFNHKCGCSCGCSPGFDVRDSNLEEEHCNKYWLVPEVSTDDIKVIESAIAKANPLFKEEKRKTEEKNDGRG